MKCPVCRASYRSPGSGERGRSQEPEVRIQESESPESASLQPLPSLASQSPTRKANLCRRCGVDLSPLIELHDQATWHYRQAIRAFQAGDYAAATVRNKRALVLYSGNADFHALAGQLWALQGDFRRAIAAWKTAQHLNPQHPTAGACLQCFHTGLGQDRTVEPAE